MLWSMDVSGSVHLYVCARASPCESLRERESMLPSAGVGSEVNYVFWLAET